MVRLPSTRLAFYSDRGGDYQVWTVKRDGSALQQLTRVNEGSVSYPVWSPDGSRMKFTVPGRGKVYLFDPRKPWSPQVPEELPPCPLTERGGFGVSSWSPDGRWLGGYAGDIIVYSLERRTFERVTDFGTWPAWLSDSRRLLFSDGSKLFVADRQSKKVREVLSVFPDDLFWVKIASDNRTIYFQRTKNEADIWLATLK